MKSLYRLEVKTLVFQINNMGSIPIRGPKSNYFSNSMLNEFNVKLKDTSSKLEILVYRIKSLSINIK